MAFVNIYILGVGNALVFPLILGLIDDNSAPAIIIGILKHASYIKRYSLKQLSTPLNNSFNVAAVPKSFGVGQKYLKYSISERSKRKLEPFPVIHISRKIYSISGRKKLENEIDALRKLGYAAEFCENINYNK